MCAASAMMAYLVASTCITEVKSRRRRFTEYDTTLKIMPNPAPMSTAEMRMPSEAPVGAKMKNSRPRNVPNHAPESAPAPAARPQLSLPVMRSTLVRSVPTIASSFTGNSALASLSTADCASA